MSKIIEHLGWKAHARGFFAEWQDKGAKLVHKYPDKNKDQLYYKAYKKLKKKQRKMGEYTFWDEMWNEDEKSRQSRQARQEILRREGTISTHPTQNDSPQSRIKED
jgi:hypothetical protein